MHAHPIKHWSDVIHKPRAFALRFPFHFCSECWKCGVEEAAMTTQAGCGILRIPDTTRLAESYSAPVHFLILCPTVYCATVVLC